MNILFSRVLKRSYIENVVEFGMMPVEICPVINTYKIREFGHMY